MVHDIEIPDEESIMSPVSSNSGLIMHRNEFGRSHLVFRDRVIDTCY